MWKTDTDACVCVCVCVCTCTSGVCSGKKRFLMDGRRVRVKESTRGKKMYAYDKQS